MSYNLQNFYKSTLLLDWTIGIGTFYVVTKPTVSTGWLVISPNNSTTREIVKFTSTGTDTNGDYVVISTRGVGGTTEQTHTVGEPIRLNITAEYWKDMTDAIDSIVAAGVPNADTTTMGGVEIATQAEMISGTDIGSTGASVVPTPSVINTAISRNIKAGDGSDGTVVLSTNTTITRDMFYSNLTINNGITLFTNGWRVYVLGELINNGTISVNGGNGNVGNAGTVGNAGAGGAAGVATSTNNLKGGTAGQVGGYGGWDVSGSHISPIAGTNGISVNPSLGANGAAGGKGADYYGLGGSASSAGTATAETLKILTGTPDNITSGVETTIPDFLYARASSSLDLLSTSAGSGSGGGGYGTDNGSAYGGGGGGGSGATGGVIFITAKILTNNGTISANGGNGGDGGSGVTSGGGGGGGGGSGGIIILCYHTITVGTITVSAGTGGAGGGGGNTGNAGNSGAAGKIYRLKIV